MEGFRSVWKVLEVCGFSRVLTQVAHAAGSSNAVDVLFDVTGEVEVDDVLHI